MKQVNKDHYNFERYCYFDRWASYYYQLREVIECAPKNILEVGVGDGVLKNYITGNTEISYTNIDIAEDLHPDIVGSIEKMPVQNGSYDVVCAFEVLEHLPFEKFSTCLTEMNRVSKRNVIISVPHFGPPIAFKIKIPFIPEIKFAWKIPFPKKHTFNGQHYWEIGKKDFPAKRIRAEIVKQFVILKEFIPFENQYHHFFVLKKKDA